MAWVMARRTLRKPRAHVIPQAATPRSWWPILVLTAGLAGCGQPALIPTAHPVPSASGDGPASPSTQESVRSIFEGLAPGDVAEANCGTPASFSPSGELIACAGQLARWPSMEPIADLDGSPDGWGTLDGVETLLLGVGSTGFAALDAAGVRQSIDTAGLEGRIAATWSPTGDELWLQSGVQTASLQLDAWVHGERRELATVKNEIGATNITVSPNEDWLAIWGGVCATGSADSGCALGVAVGEVGAGMATPVVARLQGVPASAWVADDGTVVFSVAIPGGFDLWRALPASPAELWLGGVTISPLDGARLAVTSAETAVVIDLASASDEPLRLPSGVASAAVLSVSPDAAWVAYRSDGGTVALQRMAGASTVTLLSLPTLTGVGIHWTGDDRFVAASIPTPRTTVVVRLVE